MSKNTIRSDIYTRVTEAIIRQLEIGTRPWMKPWDSTDTGPALPLRHNGVPYRGMNVLLLWDAAIKSGYRSQIWMTFQQAKTLGAHVKKGETGNLIVFADRFTKTETGENGEDIERSIPFLKGYTVFNAEQIEGLPAQYLPTERPTQPVPETIRAAEQFFTATGAQFCHGGDRAYYVPSADFIQLPELENFRSAEDYAATKAHELLHWTGHTSRLARAFGKRFGDDAYAFEELIAELGAAFLCAALGVTPQVQPDHADYLATWLRVLKSDKRAILTAASQAQRAVDYLHGGVP